MGGALAVLYGTPVFFFYYAEALPVMSDKLRLECEFRPSL